MRQQAKHAFLAAGFLAVPALAGCGGSSGGDSGGGAVPAPAAQPRSVSVTTAAGLTATLAEDAGAIAAGGRVNYTITLTNTTSQAVTLQLSQDCYTVNPAYPDASLALTDAAGRPVYPAAVDTGGPPCHIVPTVAQTLAPGQALTTTTRLGGPLGGPTAKGVYTAYAYVFTSPTDSVSVGPLTLTVQ